MKKQKKIDLVLATNNQHKVTEIKAILKKINLPIRILTLADFPKRKEVVENKRTIKGNAEKKAKEVARNTNTLALADDTGLFVNALNGRPGVFSARFAGPKCSFTDNNEKILRLLKKTPFSRRQASFRCVAALATPSGQVLSMEGRISGKIVLSIKGRSGFGYDPIFWVPQYKKTFAEMSPALKNKISHRGRAFSRVPLMLKKVLKESNIDPFTQI